ncbi:MAG: alpha/beta hydrolase [Alphaproteobacteria bacterium]|nr:alpha/beta hydrolase [Alphaproteobacteria bacterium]
MEFETLRLAGDGLTLAADAIGDPAAPPVLFFHGGGQSRRSWRGAARRIAEAGYRALTFDLRGHGDSDWASDGDYLLDAYARDVGCLVEGLGRKVALVGASRGGQAALVGGTRHPEKVALIMLADVAPLISDMGVDRIRAFFWASNAGFTSLEEAAAVLSRLLERPPVEDNSGLAKALRTGSDGRLYWHWDPRTVAPEFLNPPSEGQAINAAAARARMQLVLVRAEHSDIVTDEGVRLFRSLAPQLIVREAKGAGHMFTSDRNDAFAAALHEFLQTTLPVKS